MANEATLRKEISVPVQFKCADGTGIEKGALLKLSDPLTAALSDGNNDIFAGIAAGEKIASNGTVYVSAYRRGDWFEVLASGALSAGDPVVTAGAPSNSVIKATTNQENVIGIALEDVADGSRGLIELNPTVMQLA